MTDQPLGLLAEIDAFQTGKSQKSTCVIGRLVESLGDELGAELIQALANSKYSHKVIFDVLRGRGYSIGVNSIGRHRRGECSCVAH